MRPLVQGEVGVSFVSEGGKREIVRETELRLIDRSFISGDFCKRSVDDAQSGVVRKAIVRTRIEHVISGEPVDGWYTSSDFQPTIHPEMGSYVVYNDWVGQVSISSFSSSCPPLTVTQVVEVQRLPLL